VSVSLSQVRQPPTDVAPSYHRDPHLAPFRASVVGPKPSNVSFCPSAGSRASPPAPRRQAKPPRAARASDTDKAEAARPSRPLLRRTWLLRMASFVPSNKANRQGSALRALDGARGESFFRMGPRHQKEEHPRPRLRLDQPAGEERLCFADGRFSGYDGRELATLATHADRVATWRVASGGRTGMAIGEEPRPRRRDRQRPPPAFPAARLRSAPGLARRGAS
jgi:hypothetical protein